MPHKAPRPCKHPRCGKLVEPGESYCELHKKEHANDHARSDPERGKVYRTTRWRTFRRMYLAEHPLCVECGAAATQVDHITDWTDNDSFWDPENLQPLCDSCHSRKTAGTRGWGRDSGV